MKKAIVISVGGSIIVPGKADYDFLKNLKATILKLSKRHKIVICAGGGSIARDYMSTLKKEKSSEYVQDLMGIEVTRLNAKLVASFIQECNQEIPTTLEAVADMLRSYDIVVCGGLAPGQTSDGTTAQIADYLSSDTMVNITNVPGLYTKDPKRHKDAKLIPRISHADFGKIMSKVNEKPGQHFVLDSLAAKISKKAKIKVIILQGMKNLENYILGKKFVGTVIS